MVSSWPASLSGRWPHIKRRAAPRLAKASKIDPQLRVGSQMRVRILQIDAGNWQVPEATSSALDIAPSGGRKLVPSWTPAVIVRAALQVGDASIPTAAPLATSRRADAGISRECGPLTLERLERASRFGPTGDTWNPISGDLSGAIIHGG